MQRTLAALSVVILSLLGCSGQETTQSQSSTDSSAKIEWDTTSPPLTTSIADIRAENAISSRDNADYSMVFSNPWGPMLMPMNMSPYGDRIGYNRKTRYEVKDLTDVNPFLRRPDGYYPPERNDTTSPDYRYERQPIPSSYQPYPPSGMFYPQPIPPRDPRNMNYPDQLDSIPRPQVPQTQETSEPQLDSAASPPPAFYRPPPPNPYSNRDNGQFFSYPPMNYFWRNRGDVRNQDNTVPSRPYPYDPGFYPPGGPQLYPEVNVFVRPPSGDEDSGSSPQENTAERQSNPQENIAERRQSPSGPVPSTVNFPGGAPAPFQPNLPLPPNPFPYGYPPQGFRPQFPIVPPGLYPRPRPVLPNIPPPPPNNNLVDGPIPVVPALQPKPADAPIANISPEPAANVPDVVNVDVFDPDTTKPSEVPSRNIPYKFGYDMNDGLGTDQHREETANEAGVVTGSYGYRDLHGVYRVVNYIADKDGFRAFVKTNEPGAANPGSADVVVLAESPPLQTVVEGLRRSDIGVDVTDDRSEMEIESVEKK